MKGSRRNYLKFSAVNNNNYGNVKKSNPEIIKARVDYADFHRIFRTTTDAMLHLSVAGGN